MDDPGLSEELHVRALAGLARINLVSRSGAAIWREVRRLSAELSERPIRILDLACGGGDVAIRVAKRARRHNLPVQISCCDRSATAIAIAARRAERHGIAMTFFQADVLNSVLPSSHHVVMCSLFLHHLDDEQSTQLLRQMDKAAMNLALVDDLIRSRPGFLLACAGTRLLSRSRIVWADGPLSVRAAYSLDEAKLLAEKAGLTNCLIARHWPQRFLLQWTPRQDNPM